MLAQDPLTGYLHEVPEALYGYGYGEYPEAVGEPPDVYDGLGYPVGLPFLAPIAAAAGPLIARAAGALAPAAGQLVSRFLPQAGGLLSRLLPGGAAPVPPAAPLPSPAVPVMPPPPIPGLPGMPMPSPFAPRPFFRAPHPVGWVTPALPFTGMRPRRMYLRCAVWPGPAGLVPGFATQPLPGVPGLPAPGAAMPVPVLRRRRRRRR
jgi:hypothetical protein